MNKARLVEDKQYDPLLEERIKLRAVAYKLYLNKQYTLSDYFRFCEQNNILVF